MAKQNSDKKRCEWCLKDELYMDYHDNEWGIPSHEDQHLFEHLILETFQSGLSWYTILVKRENFKSAFYDFDAHKMSKMGENDIERLMRDEGIIRNRAKIKAAINNASCYIGICEEFGSFDSYIWQFTDGKTLDFKIDEWSDVQKTIPQSDAMAKDLKKRGFKFVGSTTCMAYMEAVGMVNHHFSYCWKSHHKLSSSG
ncbi:DNA-3-methyladenine glycosylase I [bacterium]|nr:DNA-3-methyladenine glycosylase I [bacterium]